MSIRAVLRILAGTVAGAILYIPLVLVPVAGPLASGFAAGWVARTTPMKAFWTGFAAGALGFLAWVFYILPGWDLKPDLISGVFLWVFLAWNMLSVMASAVGSIFGSMISSARKLLSDFGERTREERRVERDADVPVYVICPECGASNPDESALCEACGANIQRR